jgi:hypothetical protein
MKKLLENFQRKWPTYLFEVIVLIVGIYGAFAVEEWNDDREKDKREDALLLALKSEFEYNLQQLNQVIETNASNIKSSNEFVSRISPGTSNLTEQDFSFLWDQALKIEAIYRPGSGVIKEAINSGSISLIQNEELRKKLSSIDAELQELRFQEETVFTIRMECYRHLRENGSFRKILDNTADTETWYQLSKSQFHTSNLNLLQSVKFENDLLLFIGTSVYLEKRFLIPMKSSLEHTLRLISEEIVK